MPRACSACGKEEGKTVSLERCGKCAQLKLIGAAFYCSRECQRADWPAHKEWHAVQRRGAALVETGLGEAGEHDRWLAALVVPPEAEQTTKAACALARCTEQIHEKNYAQAIKTATKVLAAEPDFAEAHHLLGAACAPPRPLPSPPPPPSPPTHHHHLHPTPHTP